MLDDDVMVTATVAARREEDLHESARKGLAAMREREAAKRVAGCVYFVRCNTTGRVKIGWTGNPDPRQRVSHMQTGSPTKLRLVGMIQGASEADEKALHMEFNASRLHGEWFAFSPELTTRINNLPGHKWLAPPERLRRVPRRMRRR